MVGSPFDAQASSFTDSQFAQPRFGDSSFGGSSFGTTQGVAGDSAPFATGTTTYSSASSTTKPPTFLAWISLLLAVLAMVMAFLIASSMAIHVIAWGAGLISVVLLSLYLIVDTKARSAGRYTVTSADLLAFKLAVIIALASVVATSVMLGIFFGRL
ncbi:MAG: hypothetical protein GX483_01070 [Actinomycetaceae bacterium]|nr:hypothetical protein [Actinomycetaceae bacterium]